jgi:pyruvate dehydrogenase (quinone)
MAPKKSSFGRRNFLQMTGAGLVAASAGASTAQALASNQTAGSGSSAGITPQPFPDFASDLTTADIMVETLIAWGATHCFGIVGDGINSIIEALRKRQDRIRYIGVRHEEAAAFMASGFAKHTGQLWRLRRNHRPGRRSPPQRSIRREYGRCACCRHHRNDIP